MLFSITGKHMEVPEPLKKHAEQKTSKFPRYYNRINQVEVILTNDKNGNVSVEIIARAEHNKVFVVKEKERGAYKCIDVAAHKLERQLRRIKGKEHDGKRADTA